MSIERRVKRFQMFGVREKTDNPDIFSSHEPVHWMSNVWHRPKWIVWGSFVFFKLFLFPSGQNRQKKTVWSSAFFC